MEQKNNTYCPVCGADAGTANSFHCPKCRLPFAYVPYFAGRQAMEYREKQIEAYRIQWLENARRQYAGGGLVLVERCVAFQDPKMQCVHKFQVGGSYEKQEGVRQLSRSRNHELILRSDGTVEASGSNNFGQCVVKDLENIASVLAGPNVSYAVGQDGRVYVRGSCPFAGVVAKWRGVSRLAAGDHHLIALTESGKVYFAGAINAPEVFRHDCPWENIVSIAAANDYALALDRNGRVFFAGYADDAERKKAAAWSNIVAIAADDMYAIGLTRNGTVRLAGEGGFLDRGKSAAAQWQQMVTVEAAGGCIGGVSLDGKLHLAGDSFARKTERERIAMLWSEVNKDF